MLSIQRLPSASLPISKQSSRKKPLSIFFKPVSYLCSKNLQKRLFMPKNTSPLGAYQALCTQYYDYDKPSAEAASLRWYQAKADHLKGPILEPMCGTGRFLIPFLNKKYDITGFDRSKQMLQVCHKKCRDHHLDPKRALFADFETFPSSNAFNMIFIPSGSFCLLTTKNSLDIAMSQMHSWLNRSGRLYFEIDTVYSAEKHQGLSRTSWVDREDQSKLVLSSSSLYSKATKIQTTLNKYELWKDHKIAQTEVEELLVKLYSQEEVQNLLTYYGFSLVHMTKPYTNVKASAKETSVLCEAQKKS